jgi:hypothetical protein
MPAGDRTGPVGQGPRTGRALGFCSGHHTPGFTKPFGGGMGRGFGRGIGMGRGHGRYRNYGNAFEEFDHGFPWTPSITKDDEIKLLKAQAESLKRSQKEIEKRLSELEKEGE